jgi:hypothetical protein
VDLYSSHGRVAQVNRMDRVIYVTLEIGIVSGCDSIKDIYTIWKFSALEI